MTAAFLACVFLYTALSAWQDRVSANHQSMLFARAKMGLQLAMNVMAVVHVVGSGISGRDLVYLPSILGGLFLGQVCFLVTLLFNLVAPLEALRHVTDVRAFVRYLVDNPYHFYQVLLVSAGEELIYRATAQDLLSKTTGSTCIGILGAAFCFGMVHHHFFRNNPPLPFTRRAREYSEAAFATSLLPPVSEATTKLYADACGKIDGATTFREADEGLQLMLRAATDGHPEAQSRVPLYPALGLDAGVPEKQLLRLWERADRNAKYHAISPWEQSVEFAIFSLVIGGIFAWTGDLVLVVLIHAVRNWNINLIEHQMQSNASVALQRLLLEVWANEIAPGFHAAPAPTQTGKA